MAANTPPRKSADTHSDMRIEYLPRRPRVVTFDNVVPTVKLVPAADGKGAVLDAWTDPIRIHDEKVLELEQAMLKEKDLVAILKYYTRVEKNWFIAMGKLDVLPHKLEEYAVLKFEMREFENKFARAKALTERLELQAKWETYCAMEPVYEKILAAKTQHDLVKAKREQAQIEIINHGKVMATLKREEIDAAGRITEDHVYAYDQNKFLGQIFPSIQVGYIITKLFGVVNLPLEDVPFQEILAELKAAPRPHTLEFMRYDKRFNRSTLKWESLEEIRRQGKYVRDARDENVFFVKACAEGDLDTLRNILDRGEDVECIDMQGSTGLHVAAASSNIAVMELLLQHKANMEARNQNMETPLMVAVIRGGTMSVRWLLERDATLDVLDKARRTPLMHAILSKSNEMASLLMDYPVTLRATDVQWGWTALHYAVHVGMVTVAESLLEKRASPYATSKASIYLMGQTPLDVARGAHQLKTTLLLETFLREEPAHEVIADGGVHIWQGSHCAAHPVWASDQGFQCVITIADPRFSEKELGWLDDDEEIDHLRIEAEVDDNDTSKRPWNKLVQHTRAITNFLHMAVRRRRKILVHCRNGKSTSVAVVAVYRLLKHGVGVRSTLSAVASARGDLMDLSPAMAVGLQQLQEDFAREKKKRLEQRARLTPILSLGF
ncbi:unnamed protein product [Ascophyllum nodosum]